MRAETSQTFETATKIAHDSATDAPQPEAGPRDVRHVWLGVAVAAVATAALVATFGIVGLAMVALASVPLIMVALLLISWG